MSEVMEVDGKLEALKSPQLPADEFFDAETGVKEDDDFLKELESAIKESEIVKATEDADPQDLNNTDLTDDLMIDEEPQKNGDQCSDMDSDKLENDLLKDIDEDEETKLVFEAVEKEVEELLETALAEEKQNAESKDLKSSDKELDALKPAESKTADEKVIVEEHVVENKAEKEPVIDNAPLDVINHETDSLGNEMQESAKAVDDKESESKADVEKESESKADDEKESESKADDEKESESKVDDDLLVVCTSPMNSQRDEKQDNSSETSSDETREETNDEDNYSTTANGNKDDDETAEDRESVVSMEVTDEVTKEQEEEANDDRDNEESENDEAMAESKVPAPTSPPKENIPFKFNFLRKFSSKVGKLSNDELEELLIQKITESFIFCSETTELRQQLEKQKTTSDSFKKRLEDIKKQYNDLEMIHNRVMKDLKDRPEASITPVKITRAVGLQVYQPLTRNKSQTIVSSTGPSKVVSNKRPIETEPSVNGVSPDNGKRKKMLKICPLRPPLSEKDHASLDLQEAKTEQALRTNVSKSILGGSGIKVVIPPSVTMTPVNSNGIAFVKKPTTVRLAPVTDTSIDLTDDVDDDTSTASGKASAVQNPPALVPFRGAITSQSHSRIIVKQAQQPNRVFQYRPIAPAQPNKSAHPAPLPGTPAQVSKPGMKKIPPRPAIKINNVQNGIIVSWTVDSLSPEHTEIHSYQIYAYEVTGAPASTDQWRHVGDVKALMLPMAVTLTQFQEGQKYFFAVRAMDIHKRLGNFSLPRTWT